MIEYRIAKLVDFEARSDSGPGWNGGFDGHLSVFGVKDSYGTRFRKGAFVAGGLDSDLYPLLFQHGPEDRRTWDVNRVIGTFTAKEDGEFLDISSRFAKTQAAQETRELASMGAVSDLSHGFENRIDDPRDKNEIISCRLVEGSLVVTRIGSTPGAGVTSVRADNGVRVLQGSMEALQVALMEQLDKMRPSVGYNYIRATFPDMVVWEWNPQDEASITYRAPYSVATDGSVAIGATEEVEITEVMSTIGAEPSFGPRLAAQRASARLKLTVPIIRR